MESLYQELIETPNGEKSRINVLGEFEYMVAIYEDVKDYIFSDKLCEEVKKTFHKSFREIINYINNRIDYFETRKRKVIVKYQYHIKELQKENKKFNKYFII